MTDVLDNLFGGGRARGYQDYEDRLREGLGLRRREEGAAESPYDPFRQQAERAFAYRGGLDPQQFINKILGGYEESPQAKFQIEQGQQAAEHAGAASGMLGSGAEKEALQRYGQKVSSEDMERYLRDVLGIQSGDVGMGMHAADAVSRLRDELSRDILGTYGGIGRGELGRDIGQAQGLGGALGFFGNVLGGLGKFL